MHRSGLQRGVGIALWRQIADGIRHDIANGLADGEGRLPSEAQLSARFGVNRHTVRAAISALAHEGVLQTHQGRGTYVRRLRRLVYRIGERTRFSAGLHDQARETRSEMIETMTETPSDWVASALGLARNAAVIRVESLGRADGVPVSRSTSWFDAIRFGRIAELYAKAGSITRALAECGVADYRRASTFIEARHADDRDAAELRLSPGAIVLVTQALDCELSGELIQCSLTRFAADRVELAVMDTERLLDPRFGLSSNQSARASS